MADLLTRLESYPFDSKFDGYDDDGYPVYDRAVGASMLRESYAKIFTDGVFGTPADALVISAGDGLTVKIAPGVAVIGGAIGGVFNDEVTLTLSDGEQAGQITYSILLRVDLNSEYRSMYLVVRASEPSSSASPSVPDTTSAGITELRLGYVVVPSGATDLSGATIVNEKGLSVCPYVAPFEEIDLSAVTAEAKASADAANQSFKALLEQNIAYLNSAIDGTLAGKLIESINNETIARENADAALSDKIDNISVADPAELTVYVWGE